MINLIKIEKKKKKKFIYIYNSHIKNFFLKKIKFYFFLFFFRKKKKKKNNLEMQKKWLYTFYFHLKIRSFGEETVFKSYHLMKTLCKIPIKKLLKYINEGISKTFEAWNHRVLILIE
jgi:hypothetical protein